MRTETRAHRKIGENYHRLSFIIIAGEHGEGIKTQLAIALAQGISITAWARTNEVPRPTVYRWAREPEVRKTVEAWRRQSLERAIGRMARRSTKAADGITKLAEYAESESVRLSAWRAILTDQISVAKFSNLEHRMVEIEEELEQQRADKVSARS